jgi:hypothetical protein
MATSSLTPPTTTPELSAFTALITAMATLLGAWKLFEPKFERVRAIRNEVGHLEPGFVVFYVLPQYAMIFVVVILAVFLLLAFLKALNPSLLPTSVPIEGLATLLSPQNIVLIVFSLSTLAALINWNVPSRALMFLARIIASLPIAGIRNRFGPSGDSIGWHQARALVEGPEKGQPLLIDKAALDRIAWEVLGRLGKSSSAEDLAAEPVGQNPEVKANLALLGCVMEANYYAHRWPSPKWSEFYAGLVDVQAQTSIFTPQHLSKFASGYEFFEAFRNALDAALTARGIATPPDRALAAAGDMARTWERLKKKGKGSLLALLPWFADFVGGRVAWLDRELRVFPRLESDGMRPQLIKLLIRWRVLLESKGVFVQPFAKRQAWLLLQLGVLRTLPETKEVTFYSVGQIPVARLAVLRLVGRVKQLISEGSSKEAQTAGKMLGPSEWTRSERVDFELWQWAGAEILRAKSDKWDKASWRWKFEDDRIQRQT